MSSDNDLAYDSAAFGNEPSLEDVRRLYQHAPRFTPRQLGQLCRAVVGSTPGGVCEDELVRVLDWAHGALANYAMLQLLLEGRFQARWPEGGELVIQRASSNPWTCDA
jgi:hypothetical protein